MFLGRSEAGRKARGAGTKVPLQQTKHLTKAFSRAHLVFDGERQVPQVTAITHNCSHTCKLKFTTLQPIRKETKQ